MSKVFYCLLYRIKPDKTSLLQPDKTAGQAQTCSKIFIFILGVQPQKVLKPKVFFILGDQSVNTDLKLHLFSGCSIHLRCSVLTTALAVVVKC